VLGEPDGQELFDECEAYFQLLPNEPLHMANAQRVPTNVSYQWRW
jgi:hypothetical protein